MIRDLLPNSVWSLAGIGNWQLMVNATAIAVGGGVRVGLEDNIWYDSLRTRLAANADLLERIHSLTAILGHAAMKPAELRCLLRLEPGSGRYGRSLFPTDEKSLGKEKMESGPT
jgi:uncharacterized protein (DUF849 family)